MHTILYALTLLLTTGFLIQQRVMSLGSDEMYQKLSDPLSVLPVLLAAVTTVCLGAAECDYHGTPHPSGYCGVALATIHHNVCRIVRHHYSEYYGQSGTSSSATVEKRSSSPQRDGTGDRPGEKQLRQDLAHAELRLLQDVVNSWDRRDLKQLRYKSEPDAGSLGLWLGSGSSASDDTSVDLDWLGELLRGRGKREAGQLSASPLSRRKRDLVCDCCYNSCSFSQVALYC